MRRRLLLLLPFLVLMSGCAAPQEQPTEVELWLDEQSAAGPGPSGGGLIDGASQFSLGLCGLDGGAYDVELSCFGDSVRFSFDDRDLTLDCSETRVEQVEIEDEFDVKALSESAGAFYARLSAVAP